MSIDFPVIDLPAAPPAPAPGAPEKPAAAVAVVTIKAATIAKISAVEPELRALVERYRGVAFDLKTPKGLTAAKEARYDLRENGRYAVQRAEAAVKTEVNDLKRILGEEVERLVAIVKPSEDALDAQIKAREAEIAEEKRIAAEAEAARVALHREAIGRIRAYVEHAKGLPSSRIQLGVERLRALSIGEGFQEFQGEAEAARKETLARLIEMFDAAVQAERAEAERKAEAARLEEQRREQERIAAEQAERQRQLDAQAAQIAREQERLRAEAESAQSRPNVPADEGDVLVPGTPGPYASSGAEAAEAPPSGEVGSVALAEDGATEPVQQDSRSQESGAQPDPNATGNGNMAHPTDDAAPVGGQAEGEGAQASSPGTSAVAAGRDDAQSLPPAGAEPPTLKLQAIEARLGFSLTEAFIRDRLHIEPAERVKRAVLYRESSWTAMKAALVKHIEGCC